MPPRLRSFLRTWLRRSQFERELEEEIRFHQESYAERLVAEGASPEEALRRARAEFGSRDAHKEECREARGLGWLTGLRGDVQYAWRGLKSRPGFGAVAVVTLALAIGANTSMFTFLNAYLLRPFPIPEPERNTRLTGTARNYFGDTWSYPDFSDLRAHNAAFSEIYASSYGVLLTLRDPAPRTALVDLVSGNFFRALNGRVALGRPLGPQDDQAGAPPVVVLGHPAWRRIFGGDPGVVGRTVRLEHAVCTVVGVAEPGFTGIELVTPDFWAPLAAAERLAPKRASLTDRTRQWLAVGGLLKPGATLRQASDSFSAATPALNQGRSGDGLVQSVTAKRWSTVYHIDDHSMQAFVLCFAAFGLVLLIACANLASLMMARATARHQEMAVRRALGASRWRLVRQLLTESVLLASIGAALGLVATQAAAAGVQHYLFGFLVKLGVSFEPIGPDWRTVLFAAALALLAGALFGLAPALAATESSLAAAMRPDGAAGAGRVRPRRLRDALIAGEVAASLVLLVAAGLFLRMAQRVAAFDHGYSVLRILDVRLRGDKRELARWLARDDRFEAATEAYRAPLSGPLPKAPALVNGHAVSLGYNFVDHRYFKTLGLPIRRGRGFTAADGLAQAHIAVLSEATARHWWPDSDPIGKTFRLTEGDRNARFTAGEYRVVGVAGDAINGRLDEGPDWTAAYFPASLGDPRDGALPVRVRGDPAAAIPGLREACFALAPASSCTPMALTDQAWLQSFPYAIARDLSAGVACLALGLVSIGLYGVVAFATAQRRREIGIRMTLGARPGRVEWLVASESARRVAWGVVIGAPLSLALSYAATRLMVHAADLQLLDPVAHVATPLFLGAVAGLAAWLPARRAARIDPSQALREQ